MKYTAGPWTIAAGPTYCAIRTDARVIADMRLVGLHYNKADARLIAAAPDLLEAAKTIMENLDGMDGEVTAGYHEGIIAPLRDAIAKVTGAA
jgi:hypothetical protein